jgi:hypothetical protein
MLCSSIPSAHFIISMVLMQIKEAAATREVPLALRFFFVLTGLAAVSLIVTPL